MKKIKYIAISLVFISLFSCEETPGEINSLVVTNTKIATNQKSFDVTMTSKDITKVQTDNINLATSEYLLGYYNPKNYKKINASIVSKLIYPGKFKIPESTDSICVLDKVILKIPYASRGGNGKFNTDAILGNSSGKTSLKVFLNETVLNKLNPTDPRKKNKYFSDEYASFQEGESLLTTSIFEFSPSEKDSIFELERTKRFNGIDTKFKDTIKIKEKSINKASKLFLAIPLDKAKMKNLVWDKLDSAEFSSKESFNDYLNDYLKGIIIKSVGSDGNLLSLDMANGRPTIEFYYTITRTEKGTFKDTKKESYSIPLGEIQVNTFETSSADVATPANNVSVQGTSGNEIDLQILTPIQLKELKDEKILINDAVLIFHVNKTINTENETVPKRLLLYKQNVKNGVTISEHIINNANSLNVYNGFLEEKDTKPHMYTLRITEYIKNLIKGKQENTTLKLKVFNSTDLIDSTFRFYNSNPRGVTLYDGSEGNGDNRAQLKISYSKEK